MILTVFNTKYLLRKLLLLLAVCIFLSSNAQAQTDTLKRTQKRLNTLLVVEGGIYAGTVIGLNQIWYKDFEREHFHFFNDDKEWLQMDKVGHAFSAYYLGLVGMEAYKWAGVNKTKQIWLGGSLGFVFLSSIELLDGFSSGWGFSPGDMIANTSGYLLAASQQQLFNKQIAQLKLSFSQSEYASARPNVLGQSYVQQLLKDYNGQTYWLSFSIADFLPKGNRVPEWIALAVGYGAKGMYGGFNNVWQSKGATFDFSSVQRQRQWYASLDINLWRIKTKNKTLQTIFKTVGCLKIPAPTFEFGTKKFYPLYF